MTVGPAGHVRFVDSELPLLATRVMWFCRYASALVYRLPLNLNRLAYSVLIVRSIAAQEPRGDDANASARTPTGYAAAMTVRPPRRLTSHRDQAAVSIIKSNADSTEKTTVRMTAGLFVL